MIYEIMKKEHLQEVEKLQQEWFAENITFGFVAGTIKQIAESMTPYCLVAKDEQGVIGFLVADVKHSNEYCVFPNGVSYIEVYDLFVTKDYRSHGIGRALLLQCEKISRENGINYLLLSSATKDAEAVREFYINNGYFIWTTSFFKNLQEN